MERVGILVKCFFGLILICLYILFIPLTVSAGNSTNDIMRFRIETIREKLPNLKVYIFSENKADTWIYSAYVEKTKYVWDSITSFKESGNGITYYILLDISASIPDSYFSNIQNELIAFAKQLSEQDVMVLTTFGDDVQTVLKGGEDIHTVEKIIRGLLNDNQETHLFDALSQVSDVSLQRDENEREVVIVLSDGEDFATGNTTSTEAITQLSKVSLPVYAIGIKDTKKENIDSFGEFARSCGGTIYIAALDEITYSFQDLKDDLVNKSYIISFHKNNNIVSNTFENCVITADTGNQQITNNKEILVTDYVADKIIPSLQKMRLIDEKHIAVSYSEVVENAEKTASYHLKCNDEEITIVSVSYDELNNEYILNLNDVLKDGEYELATSGICDISMEKNQVINTISSNFDIDEDSVGQSTNFLQAVFSYLWKFVLIIIGILVLVLLIIYRKIIRNRGIIVIEGKAVLASKVQEKQKIQVECNEGIHIKLELLDTVKDGGMSIETEINRSLIVGRADICDVIFNDEKLSRQHFCLEAQGDNVFISDLNTTNGTSVNGIKVTGKRRIQPNDIITAGSLEIRIRW